MHAYVLRPAAVCAATLTLLFIAAPAGALLFDFEDLGANLPIAGDFFYNGQSEFDPSDPDATDFRSQGTSFNNEFTEFFPGCCWQGWAYSQTTDTVNPGPANQYSAVTGGGVGGSASYGIGFPGGAVGATTITLGQERALEGGYFTNTTWAAHSMTNGDAFAKVFGGASGDDPDFLYLTISGFDALGTLTGAVDFYLADFRFVDNGLDYILTDWTWLDLTGLGIVKSIDFGVTSSDTAFGFISTPAYFAMDDLLLVPEPSTGALMAVGLLCLGLRRATPRRRESRSCSRRLPVRS